MPLRSGLFTYCGPPLFGLVIERVNDGTLLSAIGYSLLTLFLDWPRSVGHLYMQLSGRRLRVADAALGVDLLLLLALQGLY